MTGRAVIESTPGGKLLQWASEEGSGTWSGLSDAAAHLIAQHNLRVRPVFLVNQLSDLGHLDIDWVSKTWSVARPTLNVIPGLGLVAVLTGSRTFYLERAVQEAQSDEQPVPLDVYMFRWPQPPYAIGLPSLAPDAIFIKCGGLEVAQDLAVRAGLELVMDPAVGLAAQMPPIDRALTNQAPPPLRENAQWFQPRDRTWLSIPDDDFPEGLYTQDLHAQKNYLWHAQGMWWQTERAEGVFRAIQGMSEQVVRWQPAAPRGRKASRFEVRSKLRLPTLAARALTVSDGFLPAKFDGWERYKNVSRDVATIIAAKLGQPIRGH